MSVDSDPKPNGQERMPTESTLVHFDDQFDSIPPSSSSPAQIAVFYKVSVTNNPFHINSITQLDSPETIDECNMSENDLKASARQQKAQFKDSTSSSLVSDPIEALCVQAPFPEPPDESLFTKFFFFFFVLFSSYLFIFIPYHQLICAIIFLFI